MIGHIDPTKETFAAFRANDRAGPIHMLNLVRFRDKAAYPDDRNAARSRSVCRLWDATAIPFSHGSAAVIVWRGSLRADAYRAERREVGRVLHRRVSLRRRLR